MKRLLICLVVLVVLLDFALSAETSEERPGRRNRNRNRNRNGDSQRPGRRQKSRGCKYERPQTKLKDQCQSLTPITINVNLNTTSRNDEQCAPTKELTFNCSKVCKYDNPTTRPRPACDAATGRRSLTQTIRSGMPSWCPQTFVKTKRCANRENRGGRRRPMEQGRAGASQGE